MKSTPVTANSFQLTRLGLVNCYLVRESDGLTLIDTGLPSSADDILAAAAISARPSIASSSPTPTWITSALSTT